LSDHTVLCTARGGGKAVGSNAPGAFLVLFIFLSLSLRKNKKVMSLKFSNLADKYKQRMKIIALVTKPRLITKCQISRCELFITKKRTDLTEEMTSLPV